MQRLSLAALAALATILLALNLIETPGGQGGVPAPGAGLMRTGRGSAAAAAPSGAADAALSVPTATLQQWSEAILARPLFNPSRRPGKQAVASTELPRLAGIIIGPRGASAIFAGSGAARAMIVRDGGRAGPYLVRSVAATGVSVLGPSGPQVLHPVYDHDAAGGSTPAAPAPGSSLLDLLRARVQNHGGLLPSSGTMPIFPHNRGQQR